MPTTRLEIQTVGPDRYEVMAAEGQTVTRHCITAASQYLDEIGGRGMDGPAVVSEVFGILQERHPLSSIPAESDLEGLSRHYPDLLPELQRRLFADVHVKILPRHSAAAAPLLTSEPRPST